MNHQGHFYKDDEGRWHLATPIRGGALLDHGLCNKGTAFSLEERRRLRLEGRLPPQVSTLALQAKRARGHVDGQPGELSKYVALAGLHERNETLFFRLLLDNIEEYMPIVYTPVVGEAVQKYSRIFRGSRGVWITPEDRGRIKDVLANAPTDDIRLIVVTDNERILGLGDQGAGGMGIPIGKLSLYTVAAGIHPAFTLPVSLDVGTDNQSLLDDELYLGWRHPRLRGEEYDSLVEEFVVAVRECFPSALLQWEDFKKQNAFDLLDRYRDRIASFNDDIEGTAAVAVAGLMASSRVSGIDLEDQRVLILGAGAAGVGIGRLIRSTLAERGLEGTALSRAIAVTDSQGLLVADRAFKDRYKAEFAWPVELAETLAVGDQSVESLVRAYKPTALIGTTGQPGAFSEAAVREMAKHVDRPAIFPFSNPTAMSEAHPRDLLEWTEGRALIATGSPFGTVEYQGRSIRVGQGNNVYVFPGIGLGCLVAHASKVTPSMFAVAARALAGEVTERDLEEGALFPAQSRLRDVGRSVAAAVVREAKARGVARVDLSDGDIEQRVAEFMWEPSYAIIDD